MTIIKTSLLHIWYRLETNNPKHLMQITATPFHSVSQLLSSHQTVQMINLLNILVHYHLGMTSTVISPGLKSSVFWRKGVRMIALTWQKCDQGMMLNEGMFVALNEIEALGRPG